MASFYMRGSSLTPAKTNQQEDPFLSSSRPRQNKSRGQSKYPTGPVPCPGPYPNRSQVAYPCLLAGPTDPVLAIPGVALKTGSVGPSDSASTSQLTSVYLVLITKQEARTRRELKALTPSLSGPRINVYIMDTTSLQARIGFEVISQSRSARRTRISWLTDARMHEW
jgi:hypothetical protein